VELWWPAIGHPVGKSEQPWFEVIGSLVYPTLTNREARSPNAPWYQLRNGFAYPIDVHPAGASPEPWFETRAPWVYPAAGHPFGASLLPWFEIAVSETAT
jgi:hypothetical protein